VGGRYQKKEKRLSIEKIGRLPVDGALGHKAGGRTQKTQEKVASKGTAEHSLGHESPNTEEGKAIGIKEKERPTAASKKTAEMTGKKVKIGLAVSNPKNKKKNQPRQVFNRSLKFSYP